MGHNVTQNLRVRQFFLYHFGDARLPPARMMKSISLVSKLASCRASIRCVVSLVIVGRASVSKSSRVIVVETVCLPLYCTVTSADSLSEKLVTIATSKLFASLAASRSRDIVVPLVFVNCRIYKSTDKTKRKLTIKDLIEQKRTFDKDS